MDKLDMTGTRAQLYNGLLLLSTFFSCRLVYGTYQSYCVFRDIWAGINSTPDSKSLISPAMTFATPDSTVPVWLGSLYLASNMTLNFLNFYWFFMMIRAVRKRFEPSQSTMPTGTPVTEAEVDLFPIASGAVKPAKPRRRKA